MAHVVRDRQKLINRVRRIRGQVDAVERVIQEDRGDCERVLQTIAACHGAINSLMAEVIEGHIRFHLVDPDRRPTSKQARAARQLMDVIRAYLR